MKVKPHTFASRAVFVQRVRRFEEAAIERSWLGSQPPEDWHLIETKYQIARDRLLECVPA